MKAEVRGGGWVGAGEHENPAFLGNEKIRYKSVSLFQ